MKFALYFSGLILAASALGQSAPPAGVASEWDVRKLLERLDVQAQHLKPVIEQVKPESWTSQGAPETYQVQWKAARAELGYFLSSDEALARQPDKLTLALDTYFRMQAMESTLGSLMEGVRKYQSPELAEQMQTIVSENGTNRDQLRQYMQDLAAQKEQEFRVADTEAQRCRGMLVQQPTATPKKTARP
jgi:hypothetical protein